MPKEAEHWQSGHLPSVTEPVRIAANCSSLRFIRRRSRADHAAWPVTKTRRVTCDDTAKAARSAGKRGLWKRARQLLRAMAKMRQGTILVKIFVVSARDNGDLD
jgi:hypothetical protein